MNAESLPIGEPVVRVEDTILFSVGSTESNSADAAPPDAVLWVRDRRSRDGWRARAVQSAALPLTRRMGFRRND